MKSSVRKPTRPVKADVKQAKQERRKALKTIAKAGLYTPPALLAFLKNTRAKPISL